MCRLSIAARTCISTFFSWFSLMSSSGPLHVQPAHAYLHGLCRFEHSLMWVPFSRIRRVICFAHSFHRAPFAIVDCRRFSGKIRTGLLSHRIGKACLGIRYNIHVPSGPSGIGKACLGIRYNIHVPSPSGPSGKARNERISSVFYCNEYNQIRFELQIC